jgi:hypothetical protein
MTNANISTTPIKSSRRLALKMLLGAKRFKVLRSITDNVCNAQSSLQNSGNAQLAVMKADEMND